MTPAPPRRTIAAATRRRSSPPRCRSRKAARTSVGAAFALGARYPLPRPNSRSVSARLFRRHRPDVVDDVAAHPTGVVSVELREDRRALALRTALVSLHRLALDAGLLSPLYRRWGASSCYRVEGGLTPPCPGAQSRWRTVEVAPPCGCPPSEDGGSCPPTPSNTRHTDFVAGPSPSPPVDTRPAQAHNRSGGP